MAKMPTRDEILNNARAALARARDEIEDAADWLRSDWQPDDAALTAHQAETRTRYRDAIVASRRALEEGLR